MNFESLTSSQASRWARCKHSRSQRYGLPAAADGSVGGFQDSHHAKTGFTVVEWLGVFLDTLDEIRRLRAQRFHLLHLRRPHVSRTIADQQLVQVARIRGHTDSLVVDPQLFVSFQIVPD